MNKGTNFSKKIQPGDYCLFYLAGTKTYSQCIVATAIVEAITNHDPKEPADDEDLLSQIPEKIIQLKDITYVEPLSIIEYINKLSFITSKVRWGSAFQGGCRKIGGDDLKILNNNLKKKTS